MERVRVVMGSSEGDQVVTKLLSQCVYDPTPVDMPCYLLLGTSTSTELLGEVV